ncbi:hypothetical protein TRV_00403 [Trichophyton verrucosum HKI 0517]|uniref:Uncharacterized protein n=1 Tax=Trichophyton verrucosum (strain HKI 0517) TaxID=663202 RepID=D4D009_TRIVH|nr:uncharacterized protein TRV_00403 [Trichophyton verrucosum HKI 0517]EFE44802.1 hypothetical protein TRV_00403 [Trichophyton verrucosum HKI 0517]
MFYLPSHLLPYTRYDFHGVTALFFLSSFFFPAARCLFDVQHVFPFTASTLIYPISTTYNKACSMPGRRAEKTRLPSNETKKKKERTYSASLYLFFFLFFSSSFSVSILFHFDCAASLRKKKVSPFLCPAQYRCISLA